MTHLVEEQRAAVGCLEETRLGLAGVGEGAALVAEQLGLEERLRNGRAVDVDERPPGAGAGPVDRPGQEPLAGPGLPADQEGWEPTASGLTRQEAPELLPDGNDAGALAHHLGQELHGCHAS